MQNIFINQLPPGQLSEDLTQLVTDFDYLGLFDEYGRCCLFINQLLQQVLQSMNYEVRLVECYAKMESANQRIFLGHRDYIQAGQLAGHLSCLVNQTYIVDFGLGNLHKLYNSAPQAIACQATPSHEPFGELYFDNVTKITWHTLTQIPNLEYEILRQQLKLSEVFKRLQDYQRNRLKFAIHRALFKKRRESNAAKILARTNFDETYF